MDSFPPNLRVTQVITNLEHLHQCAQYVTLDNEINV
jgi:hypothetical protein